MNPNEETVRATYDAFRNKDIPAVMEKISDDFKMVVPGRSIQSGTFAGKQELGRYFSIVGQFTAGTHTVEPIEVLAKDDTVVALLRATGTHEHDVFDMTVIHVMKVVDGKVVDLKIIPTDQYAFDDFWS
jgi:ketosteroid isomerase-like protein